MGMYYNFLTFLEEVTCGVLKVASVHRRRVY